MLSALISLNDWTSSRRVTRLTGTSYPVLEIFIPVTGLRRIAFAFLIARVDQITDAYFL